MFSTTSSSLVVFQIYFPTFVAARRADDPEIVHFVSDDNRRDTVSLVMSCLITLGLCVYTAIHLNLPPKGEPYHWTLWRHLKWCAIGLFAPEIVLYTAWRQYASAKILGISVRWAIHCPEDENWAKMSTTKNLSRMRQNPCSDPLCRCHSWTITHGFYGTMGGFAIDIDDEINATYPDIFGKTNRLTVTARGVSLLAACGRLPNVSLDDIKDKNKADSLAKLLVCLQAGWMVVQVVSRRAIGLPITLLEVHTVAHVACALLMYAIWWHKPRQVESPTLLQGDWVLPLASYMYLASAMSVRWPLKLFNLSSRSDGEINRLAYVEDEEGGDEIQCPGATCDKQELSKPTWIKHGRFVTLPVGATSRPKESTTSKDDIEMELLHRRLAAQAVPLYPTLRLYFRRYKSTSHWLVENTKSTVAKALVTEAIELVQPYCPNRPNVGLLRGHMRAFMSMIIAATSVVYGAIHISAWRSYFPTQTERLLWQVSSVCATSCAAIWVAVNLLTYLDNTRGPASVRFSRRILQNEGRYWKLVRQGILFTAGTIFGIVFVVSRAYLVVEAFVSIREVPSGVYDTPSWSKVFPHI